MFNYLSSALQCGDPCCIEAEHIRASYISHSFIGPIHAEPSLERLRIYAELTIRERQFSRELLHLGKPLCNARDLLVCDGISPTCNYGISGNPNVNNFVMNYSPAKKGRCRIKQGSPCTADLEQYDDLVLWESEKKQVKITDWETGSKGV